MASWNIFTKFFSLHWRLLGSEADDNGDGALTPNSLQAPVEVKIGRRSSRRGTFLEL